MSILFKTGADVYIRKPGNLAQLVQVINHALPMATEKIFSNDRLKYILNA
jgi:DNA-binding response OmpR family regulator